MLTDSLPTRRQGPICASSPASPGPGPRLGPAEGAWVHTEWTSPSLLFPGGPGAGESVLEEASDTTRQAFPQPALRRGSTTIHTPPYFWGPDPAPGLSLRREVVSAGTWPPVQTTRIPFPPWGVLERRTYPHHTPLELEGLDCARWIEGCLPPEEPHVPLRMAHLSEHGVRLPLSSICAHSCCHHLPRAARNRLGTPHPHSFLSGLDGQAPRGSRAALTQSHLLSTDEARQ